MEKIKKSYTIGLDIGTASVGWAVVDEKFNLVKGKKKISHNTDKEGNLLPKGARLRRTASRTNLWGTRLFDEGSTAEERRNKRGMRRRIARRHERLRYLRGIFAEEIMKIDDSFFIRLDESFYQEKEKNSLVPSFRDKDGELIFVKADGTQIAAKEILASGKKIKEFQQEEQKAYRKQARNTYKYPLFKTEQEEKDYYKKFPTIYHLREHLMKNEEDDLRKIYLGIHHILKYRGHFINQGQKFDLENGVDIVTSLKETLEKFEEATPFDDDQMSFGLEEIDAEKGNQILSNRMLSRSKKAYDLNQHYVLKTSSEKEKKKLIEGKQKQLHALFKGIVGNTISPKDIFATPEYSGEKMDGFPEKIKYSTGDFEVKLSELEQYLTAEEVAVIEAGKIVYEAMILGNILTQSTLAASMVEKYDTHKKQLKELKEFTKGISNDFYNSLFRKEGIYTKYIEGFGNPSKPMTRVDLYKGIKKAFQTEFQGLEFPNEDKDFDWSKATISEEQKQFIQEMNEQMQFETYLLKQRQLDNGAIPYQVHEYELEKIIERQKTAFPFLAEKIKVKTELENGEITEEVNKIITLFKFRIPYYVGTLASAPGWSRNCDGVIKENIEAKARNSWLVKNSEEKITPWNFDKVVDKEGSAVNFIERMTNFDTYLPKEKVLPKHSLLYQEFSIYNELIIGGYEKKDFSGKLRKNYFSSALRKKIVEELFKKHKKVTIKQMLDFLKCEKNLSLEKRDLFGIDISAKDEKYNTSYSTYIDLLKVGISEKVIDENREIFEEIIAWQTIFEDTKVLKKKIRKANKEDWGNLLTDDQVEKLAKKHYKGWGRLSRKLLDGIRDKKYNRTVIENLKEGKQNFRSLLEDEAIVKVIKKEQTEKINPGELTYKMVEALAGSPALKKGIWQSLQIIQELEKYLGQENISKVVIEMSREDGLGRTQDRKKTLEDSYKKFEKETGKEISKQLKEEFANTDNNQLRKEKVYLYFLQNGKCMYTREKLDLSKLSGYEVDHIIPQSYTKDNSFDNKVLVTRNANQGKGGDVPGEKVVSHMEKYWERLAKGGMVSSKKLASLRMLEIGNGELKGFINRQLVETRQITKHVANILTEYFKGADTLVLTPKSALTSQLRSGEVYLKEEKPGKEPRFFKERIHEPFVKIRELNDYHHAHDAYLNAVVGIYLYNKFPELRDVWIYGRYEKDGEDALGKFAEERKKKSMQLLSDMRDEEWEYIDTDTKKKKKYNREEVFKKIREVLGYRNVNVVKKVESQIGKFGDESIYKADREAKNFSTGLKKSLEPRKYGGTKAPISAFTVLIRSDKGAIKPLSISSMLAKDYLKEEDKRAFLEKEYPEENIKEIVVEKLEKYSKYLLPNGGIRLLASYQEAQNGDQLPMLLSGRIKDLSEDKEKLSDLFDNLMAFVSKNKLFTAKKLETIPTIREFFVQASDEEALKIIEEILRVVNGSNQNLGMLKVAGLGTTAQQLKSGNLITNNTTLIHQSITGLYETRIKLE